MSSDSTSTSAVGHETPIQQSVRAHDDLVECRLAWRIESLPLFARVYRSAFKSGYGEGLPKGRQFASRLVYYSLERLFLMREQRGRAVVTVRGEDRPIVFDCRNRQFNVLYFKKFRFGYELPVAGVIQYLLRKGGVLYDVGANWGYFSLLACSRSDRQVTTHAFEPWPASHRDLVSVIEQAGLDDRVVCHHRAVGSSAGRVQMRSGRHSGLASVVSGAGGGVSVEQVRLDDLDIAGPTVMKIDVEGGETGVIEGALEKIDAFRPAIVFENALDSGPGAMDMLALLESLGYRLLLPVVSMAPCDGGAPFVTCDYDLPGSGHQFAGVRFHPISRVTRRLHTAYANLLAVHESRMDELNDRLVH